MHISFIIMDFGFENKCVHSFIIFKLEKRTQNPFTCKFKPEKKTLKGEHFCFKINLFPKNVGGFYAIVLQFSFARIFPLY